jgi:DNA-binding CsgD family transcriptional regulator
VFDDLPRLVGELTAGGDPGLDTESEIVRRMLFATFPRLAREAREVLGTSAERPLPASAFVLNNRLRALLARETSLARGADPGALADAKQILAGTALSSATFRSLAMSVWALIHADRLAEAEGWTARLLKESQARGAADWQATFAWTSASVALRLGNLPAAERYARAATAHMPAPAWGVRIGGVHATLLQALTAMGKYAEATEVLNLPLPDGLFDTPYGVEYLHARGRLCLARHQYLAAIADFTACKELMAGWQRDRPLQVPWRAGAAEAWLHLGNPGRARQLAQEQLSLLPARDSGPRGTALRVLALTRPPRERIQQLGESVEMLRRLDRKAELVQALVDLGHAYQAVGDSARQRVTVLRARHLMQECQAKGGQSTAPMDVSREPAPAQRLDAGEDKLAYLSLAERRVGELAALGRTNREISSSLCITISTVEQHLTRVYRKLNIQRRQDLPAGLRTRAAASEAERHAAGRNSLARKHA